MSYIAIHISLTEPTQVEWLTALFDDQPVNGWLEESDRLTGYLNVEDWSDAMHAHWLQVLQPFHLNFTIESLPDTNWNEVWERNFSPVHVDDFVAVRAIFHPPLGKTKYELVIQPTRAFGTGHHETTYMMIEQMRSMDFTQKRVLDFGSGTGLLAILASKLGAAVVHGVDNEPPAILISEQNMVLNETPNVRFYLGSLEEAPLAHYDVILANIHRSILVRYMSQLYTMLGSKGVLLLSGILESDTHQMEIALAENSLKTTHREVRGIWQMWQVVPKSIS